MGLAENIRYFREKKNMYQSDLGHYLGVSAQAVSKWELGKSEPDQSCIVKMCQLFEISSDQLFGIEPREQNDASPRTIEARIVSGGMDKLPQNERETILSIVRAMYKKDHPGLFENEKDDEDEA